MTHPGTAGENTWRSGDQKQVKFLLIRHAVGGPIRIRELGCLAYNPSAAEQEGAR